MKVVNQKVRLFFTIIFFTLAILICPTWTNISNLFSPTINSLTSKINRTKKKISDVITDEVTLLSFKEH